MPTCHGTTKSGARCKRSIAEGERLCSTHADQVSEDSEDTADSCCEPCCESLFDHDPLDALLALAVGGALLGAVLVFRRVFRVF